jgi:exodeoxyribonuclease VII large subunit
LSNLPTYFSLSKTLNRVKTIIDDNIDGKYFWLKVEITSINYHISGHTYIELAENINGKTVAKYKAIIWSHNLSQ